MTASPELQAVDKDAARVCRGYAIEGEVAFVLRTTGHQAKPFKVIGPADDRRKIAAFLRAVASDIERGADIVLIG